MFSRRTRTKLAIYLASSFLLNVFVFWQSWSGIRIGLPDFTIFYTASQIIHEGRGADLYEEHLQEQVQRSFSPIGFTKRDSVLPYNHPPFEALLFVPLARFSYVTAYFIWLFVNVALVVSLTLVLRSSFPVLGKEPLALWLLASFAFFPIFLAIMQGQDSVWLLFCYCMAYSAFCSDRRFRMGVWLALGLCKFQLILPFVLAMSFSVGRKFINGFLAVAGALFFIGVGVVGVQGWLKYPAYLWSYEGHQSYGWKLALGDPANLRGLVDIMLVGGSGWLKVFLLVLVSGIVLAVAMVTWRGLTTSKDAELAFAVSLLGTILVSYHLYIHDLSLVWLANLIAVETIRSSSHISRWIDNAVVGCAILLTCTPLYLMLILRYKHSEAIGFVILLFAGALCMERSKWGKPILPGMS